MQLVDVSRNYDRAAPWYDRWNDLILGRLLALDRERKRTVDLLGPLEGATVLDVGCGTGRNLPLLVPRVGPAGRVIAVDYSAGMLAEARRRIEREGWTNVEVIRDDAAVLGQITGPVDAVLSVWCLGIVHDLPSALHRLVDLLRPGGRLAIMDFGRTIPPRGPLRWLAPVYHRILEKTGVDSREDLDDEALHRRWEEGCRLLRERLDDLHEESYLQGGGMILSGTRPAGESDQ